MNAANNSNSWLKCGYCQQKLEFPVLNILGRQKNSMKPNKVKINGIEVQYNKNWAICDISGRPELLNQLRGQQILTLAPNNEGELVQVLTNVADCFYDEEDNNQ